MTIEEIKKKVKEIDKEHKEDDLEEIRKMIDFESWGDLCEEWMVEAGFVYDEDKGAWIDTNLEEDDPDRETSDDPSTIVCNNEWENDVVEWAMENKKEEFEEAVEEWKEEKKEKIINSPQAIETFAREANKRWGLSETEVLNNLRSGGRIGAEIRNYLLGEENSLFDITNEKGEWAVPQMLSVSNARHTMTNYDEVEKNYMDEFEVDETRKEFNKFAKQTAS